MTSKEEYTLGSDGMTYRRIKSYAKDKYRFLELYMDLFTKTMKSRWELVYVDLFSSNGKCIIEGTDEEINGSALIALNYPFSRFILNDLNDDRIKELRKRIGSSYPKLVDNCIFMTTEADSCLQELYQSGEIGKRNQLLLIFSDPNDLSPSFQTVEFISKHLRADLFFHLSYGIDLKRNLRIYLEQKPSKLDRFLGNDTWRAIKNITAKDIVAHYFGRLSKLGYGMIDINEEFPMPTMVSVKGKRERILYYLFIVSKNPLGNKFAGIARSYANSQISLFDTN